ncbi:hypothetical protein [Geotoga petraea]|uniref:Uncharacterized protein n=1 Tax=Geotoga petraea TaxID=28234 RepID=A0A1G6LLJ5_9BACT|nr:hypothetical protein [Geotoga petraea]SDC44188.1 hypothetical protein SAMN04488588_1077 [Geotoga petraea]
MKKIFLIFFILSLALISFSFEQNPNNIFTKYRLYFSPDGLDSWASFDVNFTSEDYFLEKDSKIKYKINLEYVNKIIEDDIYGQEIVIDNLELDFEQIKLQINEEQFKLFPDFILHNLYFYYKDLNGKYLENRYMIAYNENEKLELDNLIRDDEFGIGYETKINKNEYEFELSYIDEVKEKTSSIDSKYEDIVEHNYEITEFDNNKVIDYVYDKEDFDYSETFFEYSDVSYKLDFNIDMKSGIFKGFRTDTILGINYNYDFDYENKEVVVDYLKTEKEVDSNSSTVTNNMEQEAFSYKEYTNFSKEINYDYLSDTYYVYNYLGNGFLLKPSINLYLKDNYFIVTNAYDHFMKLRYDFKGLSSMKATSTTLSFDTFFYGKDYNINILNGIQFKINNDSEIENAFYLDINNIYRGFENIRPEFRVEYFNSKDIKNLTIQPRLFAKYGNFKINIEDYIDYDVIEEELENTFLINPYYAVDDLEIGIKLFNFKYRAFGDAYYKEFLTKTENLNWYVYLEFLKYFYL